MAKTYALRDGEQSEAPGAQQAPLQGQEQGPGNQALLDQVQAPEEELSFLQAAEEEVQNPLTATQVTDAVSYHRSQPWKYGPAVMNDIQKAVGAPQTGQADEATVQGVAREQVKINRDRRPTPPLVVDGKAGPRTLPALVPMGLGTDEQIDAYVADVEGKRDELDGADAETRRQAIEGMINARLDAIGVPQVKLVFAKDEQGNLTNNAVNTFIHSADRWDVEIQKDGLSKLADGAALVYHEARHAEQQFQVCRMRAAELASLSKNDQAVSIAVKLQVPLRVALAAVEDPLAPGSTEYTIARNLQDPEPGRTFGGQDDAAKALSEGIEGFLRGQRDRASLEPLYDEYVRAYNMGYRDIPAEWDAFFVSEKVGDKLGAERTAMPSLDEFVTQVAKAKGLPIPEPPAR